MTTISPTGAAPAANPPAQSRGALSALDQNDFLRLMTVQMQQQDPFDPVDQKEMLAQMAQFSALAGTTEMGESLQMISAQLEYMTAVQEATAAATLELTQTLTKED